MAFKFENLEVWKKAMDLSFAIHKLTKNFPKDELYSLTSQIKRAADSVVLNIAEGSISQSDMEFKRFLKYSIRSSAEVVACLYLGKERKLISEAVFCKLYKQAEEVIKMTQGLKKSLN